MAFNLIRVFNTVIDFENDQAVLDKAVGKFRKMLVFEVEKVNRHYEKIEVEASASLEELNSRVRILLQLLVLSISINYLSLIFI